LLANNGVLALDEATNQHAGTEQQSDDKVQETGLIESVNEIRLKSLRVDECGHDKQECRWYVNQSRAPATFFE
jgi:hypothetical protein